MAKRQVNVILRQLQKLLEAQPSNDLSDGQLLRRFVRNRDETAFEMLVQRHGQLVWNVCRHVLPEHDAEDAFQATFLVLARKASSIRDENAVGSWLYGVAFRVARKARLAASRRRNYESKVVAPTDAGLQSDVAWRELQAMLDEELAALPDKYRAPFVLCCLEGKSKKEAAAELGWKEGTVSSRLAHARKVLQARLSRRGVTLSALLCGTELARDTAAAAVPALVSLGACKAALAFVADERAGLVSENAARLARETLQALSASKFKFSVALLVALSIVGAGTGMLLRQGGPRRGHAPGPQPGVEIGQNENPQAGVAALGQDRETTLVHGRVSGADGRPLAGAEVAVVAGDNPQAGQPDFLARSNRKVLGLGRTNERGEFRLLVPRTSAQRNFGPGVIVNNPGHGLGWYPLPLGQGEHEVACALEPGQTVVGRLLDPLGKAAARVPIRVGAVRKGRTGSVLSYKAPPEGLPLWPAPVVSDEQGNFVLRDMGPDCGIDLLVADDRFAPQWLSFQTSKDRSTAPITFTLAPRRLIVGMVTCADSGQPMPRANVFVFSFGGAPDRLGNRGEGQTDAQGRFQIAPYPGQEVYVTALPQPQTSYLAFRKKVNWSQGTTCAVQIPLPRGVPISGRIVEAASTRPVAGAGVSYRPRSSSNTYVTTDNPNGDIQYGQHTACSDAAGAFRITVPPGPGWLFVRGPGLDYLHTEIGSSQIDGGAGGGIPYFPDAVVPLDLKPATEVYDLEIALRRGVTVSGQVLAYDGRPAASVLMLSPTCIGRDLIFQGEPVSVQDGLFELPGCDPQKPVPVLFYDPQHHEGACAELSGSQAAAGPVTIRLAPCGSAAFRFRTSAGLAVPQPRAMMQMVFRPGPTLQESVARQENACLSVPATRLCGLQCMSVDTRDGTVGFSSLIPGAAYVLEFYESTGYTRLASFTVDAGQKLPLKEITLPQPTKP